LQSQGQLTEAISSYQQAIKLQPGFAEAYNGLGSAYQEQGNLKETIASCREAIGLRLGFAEAYNSLGSAYQEQGHLKEAIASYREAIWHDKKHPHHKVRANLH